MIEQRAELIKRTPEVVDHINMVQDAVVTVANYILVSHREELGERLEVEQPELMAAAGCGRVMEWLEDASDYLPRGGYPETGRRLGQLLDSVRDL